MRKVRLAGALVLSASLSLLAVGAQAQSGGEQADFVENFATPEVETLTIENTLIERGPDGVTVTLKIPTPEPGSYQYDEAIPVERQAAPEAFTGWLAVFNHPELCTTSEEPPFCGADDRNDDVKFGMYNFGGYSSSITQRAGEIILDEASDGMVVLSGTVNVGDAPRENMPADTNLYALENPEGAEFHAIIAPHGQVNLDDPQDLYDPKGSPTCDCWFVGIFVPEMS